MPISAIATETEQLSEQIIEQEFILAPEDTKVTEVVSARDESVKHFKLPDGTYEAVSYGHAVHRKDANGVWKDINNDLTLKTVGTKQLYTTADARVSFEKDANALTISENGYNIYMSLLTPSNQSGNMTATTEPMAVSVTNSSVQRAEYYDTIDEAIEINNRSSIVYSNVLANTDVEYVLSGNDVKENIIVKTKQNTYEYGFMLALSGLVPVLEDNVILLKDETTDEEKYIIPAPYMYDANGEYSYDVEYGLIHAGGEKYLLTVTADAEWINSEERALPVTIDPWIQTTPTVWDTYIDSSNVTATHGADSELWISSTDITLIRMNLPNLPPEATFNYANMYVKYYYHVTTGSMTVGAYQIAGSWSESTTNYNSRPILNTGQLSSAQMLASSSITANSPGTAIFSVSDPLNRYYNNGASFNGIAFKRLSGSNASVILKSYEAGTAHRAYIRINYSHFIEDGVYAFRSEYSATRWITIENDSTTAGSNVQQQHFSASPVSSFDRSSLFKITRVGNTERFIIRSMLDNNITFGFSGTSVQTQTLPLVDNQITPSQTFYIEWNGVGNTIRPYGSSYVVYMNSTSTANLTTELLSSVGSSSKASWSLKQYATPVVNLKILCDQAYIARFPSTATRVHNVVSVLQEKYLIEFGIWINISDIYSFTSYADQCSNGKDAYCSHTSANGCMNGINDPNYSPSTTALHHKNFYNIRDNITPLPTTYHAQMVFIGHPCCAVIYDSAGNGTHSYDFVGVAFYNYDMAIVTSFTDDLEAERGTAIHELGHLYGILDHYGMHTLSTDDMGEGFSRNCIYGEDGAPNFGICSGCQEYLIQNKNKYS